MDWTPIIIAIVAAVPGLMALRNQRREVDATVVDKFTSSAQKIAETAWAEVERLKGQFDEYKCDADKRIEQLEEEVKLQEIQIDNNNSFTLKLQLIITILTYQLRERGIRPYVEPSEMESITLDELRRRAAALSNIYNRQDTSRDTLKLK